jgi:RNA polymerase sigma factor (sigma-70 family)
LSFDIPPELATWPIEKLDLSVRSLNALRMNRIHTLGSLDGVSEKDLLVFDNLGTKSVQEIKDAVERVLRGAGVVPVPEENREGKSEPTLNNHLSLGGWKVPPHKRPVDVPLDLLDLSVRSRNVAKHLCISTLQQLLDYPKWTFAKAQNIGKKSILEIEEKTSKFLLNWSEGSRQTENHRTIKEFVNKILSDLPERERNVLADRYGLWDGIAETLQDVGDKLGLTRERIRQIEGKALKRIRRLHGYGENSCFILSYFRSPTDPETQENGGIITEEDAIGILAQDCSVEEVRLSIEFLQDIFGEANLLGKALTEIEAGVYCTERGLVATYQEILNGLEKILISRDKPLTESFLMKELASHTESPLSHKQLHFAHRVLEVSPTLSRLRNGTIALSRWTAFDAHSAVSAAEAVLKTLGRPAHFREITREAVSLFGEVKVWNESTIANALIANRKLFVWQKSGTYGLATWGLKQPPYVKDRIVELLSATKYPLPLWHLEKQVLEVCNCKSASIKMTLDLNPRLFTKFGEDRYGLREVVDEAFLKC